MMSVYGEEIHAYPDPPLPVGQPFDGAIEEILHLVTDCGWSKAYPEIFAGGEGVCGTFAPPHTSVLSGAMDALVGDCGFAFNGTYVRDRACTSNPARTDNSNNPNAARRFTTAASYSARNPAPLPAA